MTDLKIEAGKCYRTRDGEKAHVLGIRSDLVTYPVLGYIDGEPSNRVWTMSGRSDIHAENHFDLISEWKEPRKGEVWVNIYTTDQVTNHTHATREDADHAASYGNRLACVRVPWVEGQGLTEENGNV